MTNEVDMTCPRCNLLLLADEYEGEPVYRCETCWGYWLRREHLDSIIERRDFEFRRPERKRIVRDIEQSGDIDRGAEWKVVLCPQCSRPTTRRRYHDACPIKIDECIGHGIWLDTAEIAELQVFMEQLR